MVSLHYYMVWSIIICIASTFFPLNWYILIPIYFVTNELLFVHSVVIICTRKSTLPTFMGETNIHEFCCFYCWCVRYNPTDVAIAEFPCAIANCMSTRYLNLVLEVISFGERPSARGVLLVSLIS